jgi:enolase
MFIDRLEIWLEEYPITSLEDALAEEDWEGWHLLSARLGKRAILIGDDFLCTNPLRIRKAIDQSAANGLLLKVNQIGTLSEAAQACQLARLAGWKIIASARSGETEDNWLADLAVGWSAEAIKIGSITQSERLAKYNRLLEIEQKTGYPMERF